MQTSRSIRVQGTAFVNHFFPILRPPNAFVLFSTDIPHRRRQRTRTRAGRNNGGRRRGSDRFVGSEDLKKERR